MVAISTTSTNATSRNAVFATATIFLVTCLVALSLRIWVRLALMKTFGWDDATLLLSAVRSATGALENCFH